MANQATLRVRRKSDGDIKIRDLEIFLDGREIANLLYEQEREFSLAPGEHELRVSNRLYSQKAEFSVTEGETATFDTANVATGCGAIMFVVLGFGPYRVTLNRVDA